MIKHQLYKTINEMYDIYIGPTQTKDEVKEGLLVYQIVNKETGVIEGETTILARAISFADQFYDHYKEAMQEVMGVPDDDDDEEESVETIMGRVN